MYSFGRTNEITREEVKFTNFIRRQRNRFSNLFREALKIQLILKNIISIAEWDDIVDDIRFDFAQSNYFEELKEIEIMKERFDFARAMEDGVGRYISVEYIRRKGLKMNDEEIKLEDERIAAEKKAGIIPDEVQPFGDGEDNFDGVGDNRPHFNPNGNGSSGGSDEDEDEEVEKSVTKTTTSSSNGSISIQKSSSRTET